MLAQQIVNGLVLGSIYALAALGFTFVFAAERVVNFAYGELLMVEAFYTLTVMTSFGLPFFAALPIAMVGAALLSVAMFLVALRPLMRSAFTSLQGGLKVILVTLGFLYILRDASILIWGMAPRAEWDGTQSIGLVRRLMDGRIYSLTPGGLDEMIRALSR